MPCNNVKECACASTACPRYKKCCECAAYHKSVGSLPACLKGVGK